MKISNDACAPSTDARWLIGSILLIGGIAIAQNNRMEDRMHARMDRMEQRATAEHAQIRSEMGQIRSEVGQIRSEVGQIRSEVGQIRTDMREGFTRLEDDMRDGFDRLDGRSPTVDTTAAVNPDD